MIPPGTRIDLQWSDINSHGDWNESPEALVTADLLCSGWTVDEWSRDKAAVTFASTRSVEDDTLHDMTTFPRGCIVSVKRHGTDEELWDTGNSEG